MSGNTLLEWGSPLAQQKKALVLLSGGIDSATCLAFYLQRALAAEAAFINYGQAAAAEEVEAASAVASHFSVPLHLVELRGAHPKTNGLIVGRNAFLYFTALLEFGDAVSVVASGIHAGTEYTDCSPPFLDAVQTLFDQYLDGRVQATAPFLQWSKQTVWDYGATLGVPVSLTYSCERGGRPPCGTCLSCRDVEALRAGA